MFNQDQEYHLREIARLTNSTPTHAAKELTNLEQLNLINKEKKANLNIYHINQNCPFLKELKTIFIKTDYLGDLIKKELKNKVDYCLIFGSLAKGTEKKGSDVDLFIVSEMKSKNLSNFIQSLENKTFREINYLLWDKKTFIKKAKEGHHLLRTIKKNEVVMLIGNEDEFKKQVK